MPPVIGLPDLDLKSIEYSEKVYVHAHLRSRPQCVHCGSQRLHIKHSFNRSINHSRLGNQILAVRFRSYKYKCLGCGRYFNLKLQGVLPKRQSSESFRLEVFEKHEGGASQKYLSETHDISHATVERWYKDFINARIKELSGRKVPIILGIDEHFFTKKKGYATTFVDLKNHKVFDVVLGRSEKSLDGYLRKLPNRDRVMVVVMDLSSTYRSIVRKYFPNAKIVADRFHVVRLMNQQFLKAWKQLDAVGRQDRGLLSLMRRHYKNLSPEQKIKLERYFEKHPYLKVLWEFKHKLHDLIRLKTLRKETVWEKIHELLPMLEELKASPIEALKTLGETFYSWRDEIGRMWRFRKTNGITEGLHNKMEMISRRAFGFRNFENYRLRVLALCGWNGVINRTRKYIF